MEEQASQVTIDFAKQLIELSRVIVDIFKTSDLDRLPSMNRIIKEMYRLQHGSEDPAMQTIDVEANVIYSYKRGDCKYRRHVRFDLIWRRICGAIRCRAYALLGHLRLSKLPSSFARAPCLACISNPKSRFVWVIA